MRNRHGRVRSRNRGFTLLELGIVIGVAAILTAAIVPDLIETMRNRMAEKAAADVAVIHDAARLFYIQNTFLGPGRWPGENSVGQCKDSFDGIGKAKQELLMGGYLTGGGGPANPLLTAENFMTNPWGKPLEMTVYAPTASTSPACLFGVATDVPEVISRAFISFLPQAACNAAGGGGPCPPTTGGGAPTAGFVRCCSYVPKPGATITGPCKVGQTVKADGNTGVLRCE